MLGTGVHGIARRAREIAAWMRRFFTKPAASLTFANTTGVVAFDFCTACVAAAPVVTMTS